MSTYNSKKISISNNTKIGLDDDYILFENGEVLHQYDKYHSQFPDGYNWERKVNIDDLSINIKQRLFDSAIKEYKELARQLLKL